MRFIEFARRHRRLTALVVYAGLATGSLVLAYLVRFEFDPSVLVDGHVAEAAVLLVGIRLSINYLFRLGISHWRYSSLRDVVRLLAAVTVGSLLFFGLTWIPDALHAVPRTVVLLEWVFNGYATAGVWLFYRLVYEHDRVRRASDHRRVLVVGAGEAGQMLVSQMQRSGIGYVPVGIVDDDPFTWGTLLHGVEVIGSTADAGPIAADLRADEIVIGVPSATPTELREIVAHCESADLPMKILPGIDEVLRGDASVNQLRPVEVEDLLGREPVSLELPELASAIRGRVVMVTGAAGSIGSELCRQLAANGPRVLVLYDQAETPLYYLELELRALAPNVHVVPLVASVVDSDAVAGALLRYRPDRIFHAAAYKHVPLMEHNRRSAVLTNVLGTYIVGSRAGEAGVGVFLLVSTDKAVQPANIMGVTKHLAERVILNLKDSYPQTAFRAVRFGNVLGSNGSVLPLFRRQLENGEPLTVTSEDVTRYFMTIPEAVQLILRASLLPSFAGHVAMLDMGEPVKIIDLARQLLRLSGHPYRPGENVVITGLRPGEKLHEVLADPSETVRDTEAERVFMLDTPPGFGDLPVELASALEERDADGLLQFLIKGFPHVADVREGPREPGLRVRRAETAV